MSLTRQFHTNVGRPIHKWTHYLPIYERYFAPFRDRHIVFWEIGSGQGGSSQMWKHYFGPLARIVTLDIRPECTAFEDEQVKVRIGDQSDPAFLDSVIAEFGAPDVLLDDGSHVMAHVNATFDHLYTRMPREALYMVEDLHTAYLPDFGGGLGRAGTFMERIKGLIDEMHARYLPEAERIEASTEAAATRAIHVFDSVVILEKGPFVVKSSHSIPHVEGQMVY